MNLVAPPVGQKVPPASKVPVPLLEKRGLECPACACRDLRTLHTREVLGGRIWRRRECRNCGKRITTYERLAG